jgi:serine/threonine protein kinase
VEVEGTPFGRYRLIALLGRGGMGEVWRAEDTITDRVVAIKVLPPNLSSDTDFQQRFRREALAAARLETPHVVPIYDYGEIDGRLFVSMRLIKGRDVATVLADGPLEPGRAVGIVDQIAEALHAAHQIGLIHRDIKPSNILLDDRDFAYLIDFGISMAADDTRMTQTGTTIGTFAYIAPERLGGEGNEDARVDIYSLACVLYEALTGEPPFAGDTTPRLIAAHLMSPPPRPSITRSDLPAQLDEVIATGMAKDANLRYASTIELAAAARAAIAAPLTQPATHVAPSPPPTAPWTAVEPAGTTGHEARSRRRLTKPQQAAVALSILGVLALLGFGLRAYLDNSPGTHSSQTAVPSAAQSTQTPASSTATSSATASSTNDRDNQLALQMLDDIVRGNYASAAASFDNQLRQKISTQSLADGWRSYQQALGGYQSHGDLLQVPYGGFTIVNVPLQLQQQPGQFRVTFNDDGTVAGLLFLKAGVPVPGQ